MFIEYYCHRSLRASPQASRRTRPNAANSRCSDHHFDTVDTVMDAFRGLPGSHVSLCMADRTRRRSYLTTTWRKYMKCLHRAEPKTVQAISRCSVRILFVVEDDLDMIGHCLKRRSVARVLWASCLAEKEIRVSPDIAEGL